MIATMRRTSPCASLASPSFSLKISSATVRLRAGYAAARCRTSIRLGSGMPSTTRRACLPTPQVTPSTCGTRGGSPLRTRPSRRSQGVAGTTARCASKSSSTIRAARSVQRVMRAAQARLAIRLILEVVERAVRRCRVRTWLGHRRASPSKTTTWSLRTRGRPAADVAPWEGRHRRLRSISAGSTKSGCWSPSSIGTGIPPTRTGTSHHP